VNHKGRQCKVSFSLKIVRIKRSCWKRLRLGSASTVACVMFSGMVGFLGVESDIMELKLVGTLVTQLNDATSTDSEFSIYISISGNVLRWFSMVDSWGMFVFVFSRSCD
jgi:hypothetical protein